MEERSSGSGVRMQRRRFDALRKFAKGVRSSEYHITNACNLRCKGCWFFAHDFDEKTRDARELEEWRAFVRAEHERGVTLAILIGGEPTLFPDRIKVFVEEMPYVWISTNGLRRLPVEGFENVAVAVTMFGGGPLDDDLRGYRPGGGRIHDLFDTALQNYRGDRRVFFVYALTPESLPYMDEVVARVAENGNALIFNYYSDYDNGEVVGPGQRALIEKATALRDAYPRTVLSHPYYIETLVSGRTEWAQWGYDVCPSVSSNHPDNAARLANGNPVLPGFNAWAPDLKTVNLCCTSGHCETCRDSQAVSSWLLVSANHFRQSEERFQLWLDIAESFWSQFCWSPYHPTVMAAATG